MSSPARRWRWKGACAVKPYSLFRFRLGELFGALETSEGGKNLGIEVGRHVHLCVLDAVGYHAGWWGVDQIVDHGGASTTILSATFQFILCRPHGLDHRPVIYRCGREFGHTLLPACEIALCEGGSNSPLGETGDVESCLPRLVGEVVG